MIYAPVNNKLIVVERNSMKARGVIMSVERKI